MMTTGNDNNSRKINSEFKQVIIDLFEQVRKANARNAEKDRMIASLTDKLDTVLENQRQQRLDLESKIYLYILKRMRIFAFVINL